MCTAVDVAALFKSTDEQVVPVEATVKGQIPNWLQGSFVRLGPGLFDVGEFVMNHWFDGFGVLYKFVIRDGKVTFSKRYVQSDAYKKATEVGRPMFTEFGTRAYPDPCKNIFSRMMSTLVPELTDNDAINLFTFEDSVYIATETNLRRRIDPETLETKEKMDLFKLGGVHMSSSHAFQDERGVCYNFGTSLMAGIKHHIIKIPPTASGKAKEALKKASVITNIPSSWKTNFSYYHSFGMSDNYLVFIEQPMLVMGIKLFSIQMKGKSLHQCMEWHPEEMNKFIVIEKATGKVVPVRFKSTEAFFLLHHINTYEEDGQLVVDVVAYKTPDIIDKLYINRLRSSEFDLSDPGCGRRYVLPLLKDVKEAPVGVNLVTIKSTATAKKIGEVIRVTPEYLSEPGYELPVVNKRYVGKKYRYYYAAGFYDPGLFSSSILKVDIYTKETKVWKENEFTFPGEVQFVPSPGSLEEDEGILLGAVTDVREDHPNFLIILNARDLTEIARAEVTAHIPPGIHGIFLPDKV